MRGQKMTMISAWMNAEEPDWEALRSNWADGRPSPPRGRPNHRPSPTPAELLPDADVEPPEEQESIKQLLGI